MKHTSCMTRRWNETRTTDTLRRGSSWAMQWVWTLSDVQSAWQKSRVKVYLSTPSPRPKTLHCDRAMLDRANHLLTLQKEQFSISLKFAWGFFTSTLARKYLCCLLHLCCNWIPQKISSRKSSMLLCCSGYLLFRKRALAETRQVKAMAGQLVTITVGFPFISTFLSLLIDGRLQQPWLTDISLAPVIPCISTQSFHYGLYKRLINCMCTRALCSSSSFYLCVMRLQLAFDFDLQLAHGCAPISKNGLSATIFLNAWFLIYTFVKSHCTPCSFTVVVSILSSRPKCSSPATLFQKLVVRFRLVVLPIANEHSSIRRLLLRLWERRCTFICIHLLAIL